MLMLGFAYVGNQNGRERCYCCGSNKSVKYKATVLAQNKDGIFSETKDVYMCNKCVALNVTNGIKET